ncbi:MAG: cyclopropane-fatty-acyl-phospholipid synthase family protein [Bacteroidota bacterium]
MRTIALTRKKSFYEGIVLDLLSKMERGSLNLALPSGESFLLGDQQGLSASIAIKDPEFFKRCVLYGDIGFGEAYVDGLWDTDNITHVIKWFLLNVNNAPGISGSTVKSLALNLLKLFNKASHWKRANSLSGSRRNISEHYDLNNDFFSLFLDPTMTYSSAYFTKEGQSLQEAQLEKYKRLCDQLCLKPDDHVLEIGSGWGGNAIFIAKNYGCRVTSITISKEQKKLADERIAAAGLSERIRIELMDYRDLQGRFDKIVSVEMLEAVGDEYLDVYFRRCHELLKADGILALQVITCPDSRYESLKNGVDWIQKHIFPGSLLPSVGRINRAINATGDLSLVDLKDLGLHYAKTLAIWREQFNQRLEEVKKLGFDGRFIRKWNYYLSYCEAAFAMRNINVMQMVYSRPNNIGR